MEEQLELPLEDNAKPIYTKSLFDRLKKECSSGMIVYTYKKWSTYNTKQPVYFIGIRDYSSYEVDHIMKEVISIEQANWLEEQGLAEKWMGPWT